MNGSVITLRGYFTGFGEEKLEMCLYKAILGAQTGKEDTYAGNSYFDSRKHFYKTEQIALLQHCYAFKVRNPGEVQ